MTFAEYFPIYKKLTPDQQQMLTKSITYRTISANTLVYSGSGKCAGLMLVESGQLRAYVVSDEGREITVYRHFDRDLCLFSATCIMNSSQFGINVAAEKETKVWVIPSDVYKKLMNESVALANYTSELITARLSETMWLIEQILWKSLDKRLAEFLLEEINLEQTNELRITHESIANHLGTAREVVTRLLKYFKSEGLVALNRGTIEVVDEDGLANL